MDDIHGLFISKFIEEQGELRITRCGFSKEPLHITIKSDIRLRHLTSINTQLVLAIPSNLGRSIW